MRTSTAAPCLLLALALMACDSPPAPAERDAGLDRSVVDAAPPDARPRDEGAGDADPDDAHPRDALVDAGPPDAQPPDAAPRLAAQNAYGPVGRVTRLSVPDSPEAARRAGCLVHGPRAGTAIGNALQLAGGGLERYLRPNRRGEIVLVLLIQAAGWAPGLAADAVEQVDLAVLEGEQGRDAAGEPTDALWISPRAFDPAGGTTPRAWFPETPVDDGWLEPVPGPMFLGLPLLTGPVVDVPLTHARLTGRLRADGPGLALARGVLTGYLTEAGLAELVAQVRAVCTVDAPPAVCSLFGDQIERPPGELVALVLGFLDGFDAVVDDRGLPGPCAPGGLCNALAVCLQVEAEGAVVEGRAP